MEEVKNNIQRQTIKERIIFLIKKWLFVGIISMVAGIMGIVYATLQKPQFESRLTFALDEGGSSEGGGGIAGLAAQFGFNLGSGNSDVFGGENITEIMRSRRMIERVLLSVDTNNNSTTTLADLFTKVFNKKWSKKGGAVVKFPVGITKEQLNYYQDSILYCMYSEISSTLLSAGRPDRKLNIFEVKFKSPDEVFTKVFTDKIVKETSTFYTELRTKKSKQTLEILEERVAFMKGSLNSSITSKAGIQDANLNPAFAAAQAPLQKQQVNIQVYGGAYGELYKNMELARYQFLKEVPLLQIIDAADYPMKRTKIGRLKAALMFSSITFLLMLIVIYTYSLSRNNVLLRQKQS